MSATPESLQKFIDFCKQHITGQVSQPFPRRKTRGVVCVQGNRC
ncbi:hypothetical protein [Planktothrix agardhii]|nr:hypothetical protein [Planktothrix agardhii]MDS1347646.1 hypothetical protein [Planktothrix agardhii NRERC-751]